MKIPHKDKLDHIVYSFAIAIFLGVFIGMIPALIITGIIGILKEVFGNKDPLDLLADVVGIMIAGAVLYVKF